MIRAVMSRDDLAGYFANPDIAGLERTLAPTPKRNQLVMEFGSDAASAASLPNRIIVPDDELDQFFAWVASYFDSLSPITSFIDVVAASEEAISKPAIEPSKIRVVTVLASVEAAVQIRKSRSKSNPALLPATLRCMSWVYAQSIAHQLQPKAFANALATWLQIRNALTGVETPLPLEHITRFWDHLLPLFGISVAAETDPVLSRINSIALNNGSVGLEHWEDISPALSRSSEVEALLRGPRQERIAVLDAAVQSLSPIKHDRETLAAFCGYLASRISNGGLELWSVVLERSGDFPTMPLWYAFYCASQSGPDLLSFERSMPLRLLKEFDDASFDIDAREFAVLNRGKGISLSDIHAVNPTSIRVRLTPGVVASFLVRDTTATAKEDNRESPHDRRTGNEAQVRTILSEARSLSDRLTFALTKLQQIADNLEPVQPDLGLKPASAQSHKSNKRRAKN